MTNWQVNNMGIIEDVPIPVLDDDAYEDLDNGAYDAYFFTEVGRSENQFAKLYDAVVKAIYYVSTYKFRYERSVESLGFAKKQMNIAKDNLNQITDHNKDDITTCFLEDIDVFERLSSIVSDKSQECQSIIDKLNDYKRRIIERNNELAKIKSRAQGYVYNEVLDMHRQ